MFPALVRLAGVLLPLALAACDPASVGPGGQSREPGTGPDTLRPLAIEARGTAQTLDVGSWNVEWFGSTANGPRDEGRQRRAVRDVILGSDLDLWGLQEIVDERHFRDLLAGLPGYAGLLATDPAVAGGAAAYSDFGGTEQKVALIYRTATVSMVGARVILAERDHEFAGRPPVEFRLRTSVGAPQEIAVIVLHAKAGADADSWSRRSGAATALKGYLDANYPTQKVWVIGDFNDDFDSSIVGGRPSPYEPLIADGARYAAPTLELSRAGRSTTVGFPDAVDHHLVTDEVFAGYLAGSAEAYRVDANIPDYATTTSDHFPVIARYAP